VSGPSTLRGAVRGEAIKMRHRPAVYVLGLLMLAILVLLTYLLSWVILSHPPPGTRMPQGVTAAELKHAFYPTNMVRQSLSNASVLGGALALILGVLAVGSEYGWGTLKTLLTQRPARLQVFLAKVIVVAFTLAVFAISNMAAAAGVSFLLALADRQSTTFPEPSQLVAGLAATWLIWNWYAAFGALLAYWFKQSALAIGIGLAYVLVIESLVFGVLGQAGAGGPGSLVQTVEKFFPGPNASALVQSFGSATPTQVARPIVGATQASVVLCVYLVSALVAAAAMLRGRDVT
jgi:ABC-2 type transport system permease protein